MNKLKDPSTISPIISTISLLMRKLIPVSVQAAITSGHRLGAI